MRRWWKWLRGREALPIVARESVSVTPFDTGGFLVRFEDFDGTAYCRVVDTWDEALTCAEFKEPRVALRDYQFPPERVECRVCEADQIIEKMEALV